MSESNEPVWGFWVDLVCKVVSAGSDAARLAVAIWDAAHGR